MKRIRWCSVALGLVALTPAAGRAQRVAAPTGVAVTSSATGLNVSWNNMANASSYVIRRRSPEQDLGTATASPYTGALPQAGVSYEYQVVSVGKGKSNTAASGWVGYMVPSSPISPGVIITEPKPPTGTITPIPAGPSTLTAGSNIPGQIWLSWREVPNATLYRVTRSSTAPEAEAKLIEYSNTSQLAEGGIWGHTDWPVDDRWTYTYKVFAVVGGVVSTPSPAASAKSIAVIQPTGLKYALALTPSPGKVNVTLSWNPVANVVGYAITGADFIGMPTITTTSTSYMLSNVPAGHTYRVCVGALYEHSVGSPSTAPCIDIKLQ